MAIIVSSNQQSATELAGAVGDARIVSRTDELPAALEARPDDLVVMGPDVELPAVQAFSSSARISHPLLGVVLVRHEVDAGALAAALQAGVRQVVRADDLMGLRTACETSRSLSEQVARAHTDLAGGGAPQGQLVTIFGSKGGCGKTTLATNLSVALAEAGRRVCLVDLDLAFGDVAIALQLFPEHTIADAIPMAHSLDAAGLRSLITEHSSGLHTLLAPLEPSISEQVSPELVATLLQLLKETYEVVVVDTAPAFTEYVLAAVDVSDRIVMLTTPDVPAVKNIKLALQTLDLLGSPVENRIVVLNRADAQVGLTVTDVKKLLSSPLGAEIPSHRAVPASITHGVPLVMEQPNHPVSKAIRGLAAQLVPVPVAVPSAGPAKHAEKVKRGGLFRRKVATT